MNKIKRFFTDFGPWLAGLLAGYIAWLLPWPFNGFLACFCLGACVTSVILNITIKKQIHRRVDAELKKLNTYVHSHVDDFVIQSIKTILGISEDVFDVYLLHMSPQDFPGKVVIRESKVIGNILNVNNMLYNDIDNAREYLRAKGLTLIEDVIPHGDFIEAWH